jgi:diaminopimelate decarboxylase
LKNYEVIKLYDLDGLVKEFGYPIYIYDEKEIQKRVDILKYIFEGFSIFYSLKANPNEKIVSFLSEQGLGADCASPAEVVLANRCGVGKDDIFYSSPGKSNEDIIAAAGRCTIIADSLGELERMNCYFKKTTDIGVRINPEKGIAKDKAFEIMGGSSSKFGIDEDAFFDHMPSIHKLGNIRIRGMHVYYGSGILDEDQIISNFRNIFDMAARFGYRLSFIDFGGGLGFPYETGQNEIDPDKLKKGIAGLVTAYGMTGTRLIMESGRYITAGSGGYVTRITDIKDSHGKRYYIIYGGMNGFFRPAFTKTMHKVVVHGDSPEKETVTVAGHLCTPVDIMAEDITVNRAKPDDLIEIKDAGAYGYTMSLTGFISHRRPVEIYIDRKGKTYKC